MLEITYAYYRDTYGGTSIAEENFAFILQRAIGIANGILTVDLYDYTAGDFPEVLENRLKTAVCGAADVVNSATDSGSAVVSGIVASESVAGAWSKSYAVSGKTTNSETKLRQDVRSVLEDFLSGANLIVRGFFLHV